MAQRRPIREESPIHVNHRWANACNRLSQFYGGLRPRLEDGAGLPMRVTREEFFGRFLAIYPEHEEFRAELSACYQSFSKFTVRPALWVSL